MRTIRPALRPLANGFGNCFGRFVQCDVGWSQIERFFSLMGGGLVVLLNLALIGSLILGLVTGTMAVAFFIFEVGLVATLQAFIFTILAAIYLGGAVAEEH